MATEERVLGPMGDKVIFENDRVRIWELVIPPGGDSNCHVHDLDYVLVQLGGDRVAAVPEPDTKSPYNEYMEADVVPGQKKARPAHLSHRGLKADPRPQRRFLEHQSEHPAEQCRRALAAPNGRLASLGRFQKLPNLVRRNVQ